MTSSVRSCNLISLLTSSLENIVQSTLLFLEAVTSVLGDTMQEPAEIRVPVPWGHIAIKDWGSSPGSSGSCRILLALHGWQDNANTFDLLAPELPSGWRLMAIDFPGHGLSSHVPLGKIYCYETFVVDIRRIVRHFGWTRFSLVGHSMGGVIAGMYAGVYPNEVDVVVMLDALFPQQGTNPDWTKIAATRIVLELEIEQKLQDYPVYSYDEAVSRAANGLHKQVNREGLEILMKRGLREVGEKQYTFARDLRLVTMTTPTVSKEQVIRYYFSRLKCNLLFIRASDRVVGSSQEDYTEVYDCFRRVCPNFKLVDVAGQHFVHLDRPILVGGIIRKFLQGLTHSNL